MLLKRTVSISRHLVRIREYLTKRSIFVRSLTNASSSDLATKDVSVNYDIKRVLWAV